MELQNTLKFYNFVICHYEDEDFKSKLFEKYIPEIKKQEIDNYILFFPEELYADLSIKYDWIIFDMYCIKPIYVKKVFFELGNPIRKLELNEIPKVVNDNNKYALNLSVNLIYNPYTPSFLNSLYSSV